MSRRGRSGWRIVGLVAIIGLLGSGAAVLALVGSPTGASFIKRLSPGGGPLRMARGPDAAGVSAGLQLLREAVAACQGISYRGSQVVRWWGQGGPSAFVVDVWHQSGRLTLVQAVGPASAAAAPRAETASYRDPDGVLGMSGRLLALLQSNYLAVYAGLGSADQHQALIVEVWRPDGSLAARFWLDTATKLPLRRQMFDAGAHLISDDAFTSLKLGDPGRGGMPAAAAAPWPAQLGQASLAALRASGWQVPGLLPGNLSLFAATEMSTRSGPVVNLSYSDGLAVVSLFVQRGVLAHPGPGWRPVRTAGRAIYSVDPKERSFAWSAGGFVYTLVADAPPATVSQVVAALTGAPRLGFWQRIARGLRRLVSWINPLR